MRVFSRKRVIVSTQHSPSGEDQNFFVTGKKIKVCHGPKVSVMYSNLEMKKRGVEKSLGNHRHKPTAKFSKTFTSSLQIGKNCSQFSQAQSSEAPQTDLKPSLVHTAPTVAKSHIKFTASSTQPGKIDQNRNYSSNTINDMKF